ncbi:MAG: hypothetical protein QOI95_3451 [Acidimicrobiaceae bacterium]
MIAAARGRSAGVTLLGIALIGVVLRVAVLRSFGTFVDDAYIFFRYAENAADGHGLVFNVGEHVQGFSSPLYVLLLTAIGKVIGARHLVGAVQMLSVVLFVAATVVMGHYANHGHRAKWTFLIGWLFWFPFVDGAVNGMETMLFLLLCYGAVLLVAVDRFNPAMIVLALIVLARPEGVLFAVALVGAVVWSGRWHTPWRGVVAAFAILAGWIAAAVAMYGDVIPEPARAKSGVTGTGVGAVTKLVSLTFGVSSGEIDRLDGLIRVLAVVGAFGLTTMTTIGLVMYVRDRSPSAAIAAMPLLTWGLYTIGDPVRVWSWYAVPTAVATWWTTSDVLARWLGRVAAPELARWRPVVTAGAALVALMTVPVGLERRHDSFEGSTTELRRVADAIRQDAPGARLIAVGDVGVVGWETGLPIADLEGLVSEDALRPGPDGKVAVDGLAARRRPDVIVLVADARYSVAVARLVRPVTANEPEDAPPRYRQVAVPGTSRILLLRCGFSDPPGC